MSKNSLNPDENVDLTNGEQQGQDDNMVLDLDNIDEEAPDFEAMPPGTYNCIVENTEFTHSQRSGNPMITWVFQVTDPDYQNRLLFYHTVLNSDQGKKRLKRAITRINPDIDLSQFNPTKFCEEGHVLGMPCQVKVRVRNYQGQQRNDVQDVLAPKNVEDSYLDG